MSALFEGVLLQSGLIWSLGVQNIMILEYGTRKKHHYIVASVFSLCDVLLVFGGVVLASQMMAREPFLNKVLLLVASGFLILYGCQKIKEAFSDASVQSPCGNAGSRTKAVLLAVTFSFLNPHVYLDAFVLLGGYAGKLPGLSERLQFATGASLFSLIWFFALTLLATYLGPLFAKHRSRQLLNLFSGTILLALGLKLLV